MTRLRTLTNFCMGWRRIWTMPLRVFYSNDALDPDELEEMEELFSLLLSEEADTQSYHALEEWIGMTPLEASSVRAMVRRKRRLLGMLQELVDAPLLPSKYVDAKLAHRLINELRDVYLRDAILSGFVLALARAGQMERAQTTLRAVAFESDFFHFHTLLVLAVLTKAGEDWARVWEFAEHLKTSDKVRRKYLACARAYLAIFQETEEELPLRLARKAAREGGDEPESSAIAFYDVYVHTGDRADLRTSREYAQKLHAQGVDMERYKALLMLVSELCIKVAPRPVKPVGSVDIDLESDD